MPGSPAPSATRLGVIGWPLGHSRSPAMHTAALRALGLPWSYLGLPVPPELLEETVAALPGSGYRGINVTVPHKERALALADLASPAAAAIGAANTLSFSSEGETRAENTDAPGFLQALGQTPEDLRCVVLGAGGAARAVVWALREGGAREVAVWNRTAQRAAALASELGVEHAEWPSAVVAAADLVVNTTSVGFGGRSGEEGQPPLAALGIEGLDPPAVVVDMVYGAAPTPVLEWGRRGGSVLVDGLEVLVRQGALSLQLWTGHEAPVEVMRVAARGPDEPPAPHLG